MGYLVPPPPQWVFTTTTHYPPLAEDAPEPRRWTCPWCQTVHGDDKCDCKNCGAPRRSAAPRQRR